MTNDGRREPDVRDLIGDLVADLSAPPVPEGFAARATVRYRMAVAARRRALRVRAAILAFVGVAVVAAACAVFFEPTSWMPAIRLAGLIAALVRTARVVLEGVPGLSLAVVAASLGVSLAAAGALYRLAGNVGRVRLSMVAPDPVQNTGRA